MFTQDITSFFLKVNEGVNQVPCLCSHKQYMACAKHGLAD